MVNPLNEGRIVNKILTKAGRSNAGESHYFLDDAAAKSMMQEDAKAISFYEKNNNKYKKETNLMRIGREFVSFLYSLLF